jgi:hypothetical protein
MSERDAVIDKFELEEGYRVSNPDPKGVTPTIEGKPRDAAYWTFVQQYDRGFCFDNGDIFTDDEGNDKHMTRICGNFNDIIYLGKRTEKEVEAMKDKSPELIQAEIALEKKS